MAIDEPSSVSVPQPSVFWWQHARWPLVLFLIMLVVLSVTPLDFALARGLFFDGNDGHWRAAQAWWANGFLHTGGRWAIRGVAVLALGAWLWNFRDRRFADRRRAAAYLALAIVLSTGLVGLLKSVTNVDCPVDLEAFGGQRPYIALLADRPDELPHARCFPAAHAGSGYALLAFYFLWRERRPARARWGLLLGVGTGLLFGMAQQARGAHFLSHDVWSALLVWLTCLTLYVYGFKGRLYRPTRPPA